MNRILLLILNGFSAIPLKTLYVFSDILFFLQQYILGYRKKTIRTNLQKAFPDFDETKIKQIHKQFNRYFCDYIFETLKTHTISQKELDQRHTYSNIEIFDEIKAKKQNIILLAGHIFNWEWIMGIVPHLPIKNTFAVYHNISNGTFEKMVNDSRSRFGTQPIAMKETVRIVMKTPNDGDSAFLFVADQRPYRKKIRYSLPFLNQDTPAFNGFDKLTRKLDLAVVYCDTKKTKRGYYHTTLRQIKPENDFFKENEVTEKFFAELSKTIHNEPANWLWSHSRWKYKKGIDY